jgi:hypothetical protein
MMTVSEYREVISACHDARCSLLGAVGGNEMRREADILGRKIAELEASKCGRATERDLSRAQLCLEAAKIVLNDKLAKFQRADAAFAAMSFGGEFK